VTELEWLACTDPTPMLEFLDRKPGDRKLLLWAIGCSERISALHRDRSRYDAPAMQKRLAEEPAAQSTLLRCIFGNPFRPVTFDPAWIIPNVTTLAHIIYKQRAFDRMPDLADSLELAGCMNEDILSHCRVGNHVRGCWVVDLALGKK
jgi:hypothetical protein